MMHQALFQGVNSANISQSDFVMNTAQQLYQTIDPGLSDHLVRYI